MGINYTRISKSADWPRSKSTIISIVGEIMIPFGNRLCVSRNCDAFAKQSNRPRVVEQIERAQLAYESRGNGRNRISLILPRASSLYLSSITRLPSFREPFVRKMRKERGRERENKEEKQNRRERRRKEFSMEQAANTFNYCRLSRVFLIASQNPRASFHVRRAAAGE